MLTVAFSGGKDSTALVLRLHEMGVPFQMLHTATGNELPGLMEHIGRIQFTTGAQLVDIQAPTLGELIEEQHCLPNWRMRWCTRMIKIEPVSRWVRCNPGAEIAVGLRADEQGRAGGTFDCDVVYPLRDWGWGEAEVVGYVDKLGMPPPSRTDCAVCFYQTLHEWYSLWKHHPEYWQQGEAWEKLTGHTFRSDRRDTWPAAMRSLATEFEKGRIPKPRKRKVKCRVCSM